MSGGLVCFCHVVFSSIPSWQGNCLWGYSDLCWIFSKLWFLGSTQYCAFFFLTIYIVNGKVDKNAVFHFNHISKIFSGIKESFFLFVTVTPIHNDMKLLSFLLSAEGKRSALSPMGDEWWLASCQRGHCFMRGPGSSYQLEQLHVWLMLIAHFAWMTFFLLLNWLLLPLMWLAIQCPAMVRQVISLPALRGDRIRLLRGQSLLLFLNTERSSRV